MDMEGFDYETTGDSDRLFWAGAVAAELLVAWKVGYVMEGGILRCTPKDFTTMWWGPCGQIYHRDAPLAVTCAGHLGSLHALGQPREQEEGEAEEEDQEEDFYPDFQNMLEEIQLFISNGGGDPHEHTLDELYEAGYRSYEILNSFGPLYLRLRHRIYMGEFLHTDDVKPTIDSLNDELWWQL